MPQNLMLPTEEALREVHATYIYESQYKKRGLPKDLCTPGRTTGLPHKHQLHIAGLALCSGRSAYILPVLQPVCLPSARAPRTSRADTM